MNIYAVYTQVSENKRKTFHGPKRRDDDIEPNSRWKWRRRDVTICTKLKSRWNISLDSRNTAWMGGRTLRALSMRPPTPKTKRMRELVCIKVQYGMCVCLWIRTKFIYVFVRATTNLDQTCCILCTRSVAVCVCLTVFLSNKKVFSFAKNTWLDSNFCCAPRCIVCCMFGVRRDASRVWCECTQRTAARLLNIHSRTRQAYRQFAGYGFAQHTMKSKHLFLAVQIITKALCEQRVAGWLCMM